MECDICGRMGRFHCVTCARAFLEAPRIELAKALISRDEVEKHLKAVIEGSEDKDSQHVSLVDSKGGLLVDRQECTNHADIQRTRAETLEVQERLGLIADQADRLRQQIQDARKELEDKRKCIALRKSDFSSTTYGVEPRRINERDKVQQSIKRLDYESDKLHHSTIDMRTYLCGTAAKLSGLKITKRRTREGGIKETWNIGPGTRLRVYDLRDLNDALPDQLSASLAAVAQLLVHVAAYLGVRLPAEITLPHKEYPHPTIFSPSSSYQGKKVPFPGSTPSHSSSNSPEASRTLDRAPLPKPRLLFLDRPLAHLRAEDMTVYSSFVEGVGLLAYDVAWLCRSQGMVDRFASWEDVCSIGQNLHRLLILQETRLSQRPENPLDKDIAQSKSSSRVMRKTPVGLGELAHTTCHSFLGSAENAQYLSGWSLTPLKINDELKRYLYAEEQSQEWDELDPKEWEDMENVIADNPIIVGEKRREISGLDDDRSYLTTTTVASKKAGEASDGGEEKKKGVNGWTRVKSRNEDSIRKAPPD